MRSREQLEILEEDGLLIIPSNRRRLGLRSLSGMVLAVVGVTLWSTLATDLGAAAALTARPALWLGAALLVGGLVLLWRTRTIRRSGIQLILTDDTLVLEHRPGGTWTTLLRLRWDEIISFAPAHGVLPGAGHVTYTLRPAAARRLEEPRDDEQSHEQRDDEQPRPDAARSQRPGWAQRATEVQDGRGAIPGMIGRSPVELLETLRAAHRRFG